MSQNPRQAPPPAKAAVAATAQESGERPTFGKLMEQFKPKIAAILPKHLTAERMLALANLAATKTPALKSCTPLSLFNAIAHASRLGLEIGQFAHLVPFRNTRAGIVECVMIPDYRGLIHLAVSSEKVKHIDARVVYAGDEFEYELGDRPRIRHRPKLDTKRGDANIVAFYAVAHLADGTPVFDEPMSKAEVDAVRARSRAKDDGPWVTDYAAMGKKTVVKRLSKFLPQTPQLAAAIELDNRAETGEIGNLSDLIDSDASVNQQVAAATREKLAELKERMEPAEPAGDGGGEAPGARPASPPSDGPSDGPSQGPPAEPKTGMLF